MTEIFLTVYTYPGCSKCFIDILTQLSQCSSMQESKHILLLRDFKQLQVRVFQVIYSHCIASLLCKIKIFLINTQKRNVLLKHLTLSYFRINWSFFRNKIHSTLITRKARQTLRTTRDRGVQRFQKSSQSLHSPGCLLFVKKLLAVGFL